MTVGIMLNPMDLSPVYASTLSGIMNCSGSMMGILAPYVVGVLTPHVSCAHPAQITKIRMTCNTFFSIVSFKCSSHFWPNGGGYFGLRFACTSRKLWFLPYGVRAVCSHGIPLKSEKTKRKSLWNPSIVQSCSFMEICVIRKKYEEEEVKQVVVISFQFGFMSVCIRPVREIIEARKKEKKIKF